MTYRTFPEFVQARLREQAEQAVGSTPIRVEPASRSWLRAQRIKEMRNTFEGVSWIWPVRKEQ